MKKILSFISSIFSFNISNSNSNNELDNKFKIIKNSSNTPISGIAVGIIKNGKITYKNSFGYRYIDNDDSTKNLPLKTDTKIRIASISKFITTLGFMKLVEEKKINLDEDVSKYLGFELTNPNYSDIKITSRMLLSHTSSLRDGNSNDVVTLAPYESIKEFFVKSGKFYNDSNYWGNKTSDGVLEKPGEYFSYQNINLGVIATIIEKVSGQRFDLYMKDKIFKPLGLTATYNPEDFSEKEISNLATIYRKKYDDKWDPQGKWYPQVDDFRGKIIEKGTVMTAYPDKNIQYQFVPLKNYKIGENGTIFNPQGGVRASVEDMLIIMQMILQKGQYNGKRILLEKTIDEMFATAWKYSESLKNGDTYEGLMNQYGLSVHIIESQYGDSPLKDKKILLKGHFGEAYGQYSAFFIEKNKNNGFVYMITGVGKDPDLGSYSSLYKIEEEMFTSIYNTELKQ